MSNPNTDTLKSQTYGVEIEFVGCSMNRAARAVHSVVGGRIFDTTVVAPDGRKWKVVHDGSVSSHLGGGGELVTPVLKYDDMETLQNVMRAMRRAGARKHSSCGIHVHVGARDMTAKQIVNVCKTWNRQEQIIVKALDIEGRTYGANGARTWAASANNDVIPRILRSKPNNMNKLAAAWYGESNYQSRTYRKYDSSRYHAINLHNLFYGSHGTIEFRCFNSTMHAGELRSYVCLALAVVAKGRNGRGASVEQRAFNSETAKYDLRQWMLKLGLIGKEFKNVRKHLMKRLPGSSRTAGTGRTRGGHARRAA